MLGLQLYCLPSSQESAIIFGTCIGKKLLNYSEEFICYPEKNFRIFIRQKLLNDVEVVLGIPLYCRPNSKGSVKIGNAYIRRF